VQPRRFHALMTVMVQISSASCTSSKCLVARANTSSLTPPSVSRVAASVSSSAALRLAWVVLPPRLVEAFTEAKRHQDSHTETPGQLTLADMITSHAYDRHVRSCRLRYRHRRDLLVSRLHQHELLGISAGLHALIRLERPESAVHERAARHGLALGDYASHWHNPGTGPPGIIVGYGTPAEGAYPGALDALARVLQSVS